MVPSAPFRGTTTLLEAYRAGLSMRGTFFCPLLRGLLSGYDGKFAMGNDRTVSGATPRAFVDGRHSVILSSTFLSIKLLSGNFNGALRVTVKSGLLVHP